MQLPDLSRKTLGVHINQDGTASVCVWAPDKKSVALRINNDKELPMERGEYDYWTLNTDLLREGDRYCFVLDHETSLPDPASVSQPDGVHKCSEALSLHRMHWNDESWTNPSLTDYIIYELHTGCFTEEGTFDALQQKLSYLKSLGITAVELMPVAQFPGSRNWGYDGVFPFAVQNSYGGAHRLQQLINACHQQGLAVVLDVVYNHVGPEGNYLRHFGPYFTSRYGTPWGEAINFDDACCDGVRAFFLENALMWFRDFHVDALRLDAVHAIKDFSPKHILRELREHVDALSKRTGRTYYLIAECDLNDSRFINPVAEQGFGMDAQWIDEFHHALRVTAGQPKTGYYADFEPVEHLAKAYRDAYVYDGQYSPHRRKHFGVRTDNEGHQFVIFSQNHDQTGNRMLGERTSGLLSFDMLKLLAGAVLIAPYIPLLFMGEEYGETHPFLYFVSHSDPELIEAVRNGRKQEFAAFHHAGETPDPQAGGTFENSKLQWELHKSGAHQTLFLYYQNLISFRKNNPVLRILNRKNLDVRIDTQNKLLLLYRWQNGDRLLSLLNFSDQPQKILIPPYEQGWRLAVDSASRRWGGAGAAKAQVSDNEEISLQPESILIYENF